MIDGFKSIRFRRFSKKITKSYSETLNGIEKIEPRYGKPNYKMEISPMELAMLKRIFSDQRLKSASQAD